MKNIYGAIILFFITLFAYTKLAGPVPFSVSSTVTSKSDTFTVSGEGKTTVVPDIAIIRAGVQAQGATIKQAQDDLNTRMNKISAALKKIGIDSKDIKTENYSLSPSYDFRSNTQKITGYEANSTVVVTVRNIDSANSVIDTATVNGANQIGGISFDVSDRSKAENDARTLAVAAAKKKAQDAAKAAGFTLGKIINYSEGGEGMPRPVPMYAKAESMAADSAVTRIEPGSSEIVITVSLSYELR